MQANPDKQMNFITRAKDSNKVVELLTNAENLGIAKEVIVGDKYELTSKIYDDFSLLEYADWNNNPGIIEAYRKKFTDDEWQERLLKKFNYFIDKKLDKVSQELSAHNFDIETINTLREKFKITTQAGDFSDKIKDVIESNAIDIETNIKKSALFLNEQGLKNMAEYIVNNLSIFAEKDKYNLRNMKKIIPFLEKYLDNKDQDKLTDFKNKLETISIYNIFPNFKGLSNDDKTELIRQIDTANNKEKNEFFEVITRDITSLNANLVEVIDKLLASGAIKKENIQQKFDEIYKKNYFSKQNNIENQLIETFLKYITAVSPNVLEHINGEIKLADNEIKNAHSKEDFIGIYKKHKDSIYKGYIINYLYENKNNNEQKEALKDLLQDKENSYLLLQTSKDRKDLLDNVKDIGFDVNKYGRDQFINNQNTIEAYKNKFTNEEYKNKLLDSKYIMISNLNKSVEEVKKNINEIRSRFLITEDMLGDFNDSHKNILNQPDRWSSNEIVDNISKIILFLKEDKDINDMAEYIVSNKFNKKLVDEFDFDISQKIVYFLEKYLTDKSKLDDLVTKLTKHKDTLAYKDIIDVYKKSNLLTEEQKKKL